MNALQVYRKKINIIDEELLLLLAKRFSIIEKIGKYKKNKKLPVFDKIRENEVIENLITKAKRCGIEKECIVSIWKAIFKEAYSKE